jgi:hypothetical protein
MMPALRRPGRGVASEPPRDVILPDGQITEAGL